MASPAKHSFSPINGCWRKGGGWGGRERRLLSRLVKDDEVSCRKVDNER